MNTPVVRSLCLFAACAAACAMPFAGPARAAAPEAARSPLVVARPYTIHAPQGRVAASPLPLVLSLHGYGSSSARQDAYLGLSASADRDGFLLVEPDGSLDAQGKRFWNATDACCDFGHTNVDDVAYLRAVIDDVIATHAVDLARIYVVGHSNGGYMAYRVACELGSRVAAVVSLAGATWLDSARCPSGARVHILQIHGDADPTVIYAGDPSYPGAVQTVTTWAQRNGCTGALEPGDAPLDLVSTIPGAETVRQRVAGCPAGGAVELWTMKGASHVPRLTPSFTEAVRAFLMAHPKS